MNQGDSIHLFTPLTIANKIVSNRIVMAAPLSGHASRDGFIQTALYDYYVRRAHGGVGMIITEPFQVIAPALDVMRTYLGLYDDAFVSGLHALSQSVQGGGARLIIALDAPLQSAQGSTQELRRLADSFIEAAWRAHQAGCDGVVFSATDGGVLQTLLSPLQNQRRDMYGNTPRGQIRLPLEITRGIRHWLGPNLIIGFRFIVEEFIPGGIRLAQAQSIVSRLAEAGVNLVDVRVDTGTDTTVAQFPGWNVPIAQSIKRAAPHVVTIGCNLLSNPHLAESVVREGSVDLVSLERLHNTNPYWPHLIRILLMSSDNGEYPELPLLKYTSL